MQKQSSSSFSCACEETTQTKRMLMRSLFLNAWLYHLLRAGDGFTSASASCAICNVTGTWPDKQSNCSAGFQVCVNSTASKLNEGDEVTLTCFHNCSNWNVTFGWKKDTNEIEEERNKSKLFRKKVLSHDTGQYVCFVNSLCGRCESLPHNVNVENQSVLLLIICGVSALVLVLVIGLVMKYKLKRDGAKHRERRQQKQLEQGGAPSFIH
uniref:uncharacterized protein LOC120817364 n=1 Tax=Gasterosteus aculeatus aculeatus TaxID=481459 RepID=UPI001A98FE3F|nr:uncharacterized protein LOC120817364 [Gasterosteus aculeatus aculeatus]